MSEAAQPTERVRTEKVGQVMVIHLDDGKANVLSPSTMVLINAALDAAEADPEVGAVVLHGRPGVFSGGFDLSVMTVVEGETGVIVIDPLISKETAAAAFANCRISRGGRPSSHAAMNAPRKTSPAPVVSTTLPLSAFKQNQMGVNRHIVRFLRNQATSSAAH